MIKVQELFFELIQVAMGSRDAFSRVPFEKEWTALYKEARRQSITGVLADGIARLPEGQRPPEEVLMRWIGSAHLAELSASHYPQEALWQPFFSLWLYFWRLAKGLL